MSIIGDIETIGAATKTHNDYADRNAAANALVDAAASWDKTLRDRMRRAYDAEGIDSFDMARESLKFDASKAVLRMIASEFESNGTEASKAESDFWSAINAYNRSLDEEEKRREREYYEKLEAENKKLARREREASRGNAKIINAANDNGVGSYVYFITDGEAIKIGKANNPKSRLSGLQTSHHKPLRILALIPGSEETERALHWKFERHRIRGEWFKDCKEIREFIKDRPAADNDNSDAPHEPVTHPVTPSNAIQ
ncbi:MULTISPECIES: GIY-YIG nuclease family protein [unclassified Sinorhizobium]|uniref:GIY-YIG nuclease family protein n=1 Tax=unclassified Sinorhizobium TaxID=2613772 RepID=UPI003526B3FF